MAKPPLLLTSAKSSPVAAQLAFHSTQTHQEAAPPSGLFFVPTLPLVGYNQIMESCRSAPLFILLLCGIALRMEGQSHQAKGNFTQDVKAALESAWIELHISQALVTDYGEIHATTISLKRENDRAPVFRISRDQKTTDQPLTPETLKLLLETVLIAADEVEKMDTPSEIISRIGAEEAAKLMRERKLPSGWDVEVLVIRIMTPQGSKVLMNEGHSERLAVYLKDTFSIDQIKLPDHDAKTILGFDPNDREK
ncbi:MAG: hypothetical protein IPK32_07605 [Verrucomicrobiaceae bacterium]|nr:hypothetical protein [Verrucomicrobiaceae bacterium]